MQKVKQARSIFSGYDEAIQRARHELAEAKLSVARLKVAVKVLTEEKQSGYPWITESPRRRLENGT